MPAEFLSARAAARTGTKERIPHSRAFNRGSSICSTMLHYCIRCETVKTVDAVVSRVAVQTPNNETTELMTWTGCCRSCGTLMLGSSAGDEQSCTTIVSDRSGRPVSKSAQQRGRS